MKRIFSIILSFLLIICLLSGCETPLLTTDSETGGSRTIPATSSVPLAELGDDDKSFGDSYETMDAYEGYFDDETAEDITVTCVSGTTGCYSISNGTLTFSKISEESVYSVSGKLNGNIVIDVGDDYKFDLELCGFSLVSSKINPITVLSGNEVSVTAKSGYENFIYDMREAIDDSDETLYSAAIYSLVDLEICGKGSLSVISENNNGIHTKDDLQVKNLTLMVSCYDNALKGNDSVSIENATTTLIATGGDCVKTTNTDISSKNNQRGIIAISGGTHNVYAACDGIDAAYDVFIEDETTVLNIFTDKYSNYSSEVTAVEDDAYYIRFTSNSYKYSVMYYNSDSDYVWVDAASHSSVSGSRTIYYYYSFPKKSEYSKMRFFIYSSDMKAGQDEDYVVASDFLAPNTSYDTFALTSYGNSLSYSWTNYTTTVQESSFGFGGKGGRPGGMQDGNRDKGDYSTKGIKAGNTINISAGTVSIKSYDDAIHGDSTATLENGEKPLGNVNITGGTVSVYSNDDGVHADGTLSISGGTLTVLNSYEGLEGINVRISGGNISVNASDDGVNATATSGTGVEISGGCLYIYCTGDGIDANSRASYSGIVFSGGKTLVFSNSNGNSSIDTEQGYKYTGGTVLAIMPSGGMTSEATHCSNFNSIGTSSTLTLSSGKYLTVKVGGNQILTYKLPTSVNARVIYLGSKSAGFSSEASASAALNDDGVCWF